MSGRIKNNEPSQASSGPHTAGLFVASVAKAFQVLEVLAGTRSELSLTEIARRTGIGRSAAQRSLYTLTALGYLIQDNHGRQYRLSSKLLALTQAYSNLEFVRERASPILERANESCEETINLTVLDGTEVVYILRFPSKHVVSVNVSVGTRLPAYCTAPGRAMLAFLPTMEADAILRNSELVKMTETTETDPLKIWQLLDEVRRTGVSISNQEAFIGDISVAAPVLDRQQAPIAAVNIAVPSPRWKIEDVRKELMPLVKETAEHVSRVLQGVESD